MSWREVGGVVVAMVIIVALCVRLLAVWESGTGQMPINQTPIVFVDKYIPDTKVLYHLHHGESAALLLIAIRYIIPNKEGMNLSPPYFIVNRKWAND
jgi:hypothetical protein